MHADRAESFRIAFIRPAISETETIFHFMSLHRRREPRGPWTACGPSPPSASQSGAENENGVPRAQSLTESGDAVVLNLVLRQALCVRSRRIAVDPMAGFNAKAMPIMLPTPLSPTARGFARKRARLRPARCATHFDAARHSDGATQHFARAKSGRMRRAACFLPCGKRWRSYTRQSLLARAASACRGS